MSLADHSVQGFSLIELRGADDDGRAVAGIAVGLIMIKPIPPSGGGEATVLEIGWRQVAEHCGHGYVTEAARAVLDAVHRAGVERLVAVVDPENLASQRVAVRIGMERGSGPPRSSTTPRPCSSAPPVPTIRGRPGCPRGGSCSRRRSAPSYGPQKPIELSSHQEDPRTVRDLRDDAGGRVGAVRPRARGGLSVLCRGRIRGVGTGPPGSDAWSGRVETVLHIRPGPAGDGSAESCGNAPAFNTVETLPCAEQVLLHMGARPLETDVLGRIAESQGKPGIGPRGCACPMCNTPATGPRRTRPHPSSG